MNELKFALRQLSKRPGFTVVAILSLAIGIGVCTTAFSVVNAYLLKPLPVKQPDELVTVCIKDDRFSFPLRLSYPLISDLGQRRDIFTDVVGFSPAAANFGNEQGAERIWLEQVTANYFSALGVTPTLGRGFSPEEERGLSAHPVIVLSHSFWKRRFASALDVVGQTVQINGKRFTVVGVAPQSFTGTEMLQADGFTPLVMVEQIVPRFRGVLESRGNRWLNVIGRLQSGVSAPAAETALNKFAEDLTAEQVGGQKLAFQVLPESKSRPAPMVASFVKQAAIALMVLAALVLAICCFNVANLSLARAFARTQETAVRTALGASRWQIVRIYLIESFLVTACGGLLAWFMTSWLMAAVKNFALPTDIPILLDWTPDYRVGLFCLGAISLVAFVCGTVPAAHNSNANVVIKMNSARAGESVRQKSYWIRHTLVALQSCVALVLLAGAFMFARSVYDSRKIDPGFNPENLLLLSAEPDLQGYDEPRTREFYRQLLERVRNLQDVNAASLAKYVPLDVRAELEGVSGDTVPPTGNRASLKLAMRNTVEADYFRTMGIPILRGRAFEHADAPESKRVAIINEVLAQQMWPGEEAIGKLLWVTSGPKPYQAEVVGIAKNGRYFLLGEAPKPCIYLHLAQEMERVITLHIRSTRQSAELVAQVRQIVSELDPSMPIYDVKTGHDLLHKGIALGLPWFAAVCAGTMGLIALALAAAGTYAVIAFSISQRTHEIGVRLALGASRRAILKAVVQRGLQFGLIGIAAGLAGAFAVGKLLSAVLYGRAASDPVTYGTVALLLAVIAVAACLLPARRATHLSPMEALRDE